MARPPSDISSRIIVAARTRFLLEGVDGASLRQIAKDAGTNIGMVYYYFKTKDDLFLAVVQDVYGGLLGDLTEILSSDLPEEQRFEPMYERLSRLSAEEFDVLRLILREALVSSTRLAHLGQLFLRGHIPVVLTCIARGIANRRLRDDRSPLLLMAAALVLGIMPQIVRRIVGSTELPLGDIPDPSEVAVVMADILLHGIARPNRGQEK
jgi:AcrR family transcriptional regulator